MKPFIYIDYSGTNCTNNKIYLFGTKNNSIYFINNLKQIQYYQPKIQYYQPGTSSFINMSFEEFFSKGDIYFKPIKGKLAQALYL